MSFDKIYIGGFRGVPSSINLPKARVGAPIEAEHINSLAREIDRNKIQGVRGAHVSRTSGGTSINTRKKPEPPHAWKTYSPDGESIVVEIGGAYGSRAKQSGTADSSLLSGMRDAGTYKMPSGYDIYSDIDGATVLEGDPWSITFTPSSTCHDWAVVVRLAPRTLNKKNEAGEDIPNTNGSMSNNGSGTVTPPAEGEEPAPEEWVDPEDYVAMVSLVYYTSGTKGLVGMQPIAVLEAVRDPDKDEPPKSPPEEDCIGKKKFLYWNVTQLAHSDVALEKHDIHRHPFEVYFVDTGKVMIEQGMVYSYPHNFVDTMGYSNPSSVSYPNAIKIGSTIINKINSDAAAAAAQNNTDPPEPVTLEGDAAYLLNSNNADFSVGDGSYVYLKFERGTYVPVGDGGGSSGAEADFTGWHCTIEIDSELPSGYTMGRYNMATTTPCSEVYSTCTDPVQMSIDYYSTASDTWIFGGDVLYDKNLISVFSNGMQIHPIAKISGSGVIQMLRSDFFFYPPMDFAFWAGGLRFEGDIYTTGLIPTDGSGEGTHGGLQS